MECADDALSREIVDALTAMIKQAGAVGHSIAADFGVSPPDLLALFKLDDGISMKELAARMACDASFATVVTDALEKKGLVRREPSQRDRRVKNLVLTPDGIAAKERLLSELAVRMPWCTRLDHAERASFLRLIRKITATDAQTPPGGEAVTTGAPTSS
jgi:MarR family transcriptional regulator, organic hydroperoxide resistance regulator